MTKEEAMALVTEKSDKYLEELHDLTAALTSPYSEQRKYLAGVVDGVDSAGLIAFRAGAKAMYDLLTKQDGNE